MSTTAVGEGHRNNTSSDGSFPVSECMAFGDEYWKVADDSLRELSSKYEYRIKANKMELKRRGLIAEKIAWDAIEKYCTEEVKKSYFDSQDI